MLFNFQIINWDGNSIIFSFYFFRQFFVNFYLLSFWVSETVGEPGVGFLDVSGSAGAWSTSSLSLGGPVELTDLGGSFLLDVVVGSAGGSAQGVGFVVSFTE